MKYQEELHFEFPLANVFVFLEMADKKFRIRGRWVHDPVKVSNSIGSARSVSSYICFGH